MIYRLFLALGLLFVSFSATAADDSTNLWLPQGGGNGAQITASKQSPTVAIAVDELTAAWRGQPVTLEIKKIKELDKEGYRLSVAKDKIVVSAPTDAGLLYAAYDLLRRQTAETPYPEGISDVNPAVPIRVLNHWDNLDRTVERGYAGQSLWEWDALPDSLSDRYAVYARANASIGINGTVLNNVNASPQILSSDYLAKVKALADVFRPYNIKVYLSVNFASPMVLDGVATADPADKAVVSWWREKVKEIYRLIPDFGGFVVKANSEGQPGPCDYGRTHADGANMIADALRPYGGILFWRAFVYNPTDADRAKQAYIEFQPFDGQFRSNVIIQVKNGPMDFQPREPYSPLFTSMSRTALAAELQITQEYLGHSNHLVYLAPLWKEFFGFVPETKLRAVAGVANTGTDANWCGNVMAQSNWYAFGRIAWDASLTEEEILDEWTMQTFSRGKEIIAGGALNKIMLSSREAAVNYMMPLGLHGLFAWGHHYGPEPWFFRDDVREDWTCPYYHRADSLGLGFDRSATGSNAVAQYPAGLERLYSDIDTCPEEYLMWFHHVAWTHEMSSGRTMWDELCLRYQKGVEQVRQFQVLWDKVAPYVCRCQADEVRTMLITQVRDAVWWKDACLLYFQQFSRLPFPDGMERPVHELDDLERVELPITNFECPSPELLNTLR
ncbi:MAG: alpha-glucuronidase [Prevotella sp.]|nr:alpha-glucuronidase [Prevotella sp.]